MEPLQAVHPPGWGVIYCISLSKVVNVAEFSKRMKPLIWPWALETKHKVSMWCMPLYLCPYKKWIATRTAYWNAKENREKHPQSLYCFGVWEKLRKWPPKGSRGCCFPTNQDPVSILGRTDFHSDNFHCLMCFWNSKFPDFWISRFQDFQISVIYCYGPWSL